MSEGERCLGCGLPVGGKRDHCPAELMGATDDDQFDCLRRRISQLEAERALMQAVVEAADGMAEFQDGYDFMPTNKAGRELAAFRAARSALDAHRKGSR